MSLKEELVKKIYQSKKQNILSKKEIVKIEKYYKDNYQTLKDYDDFTNNNPDITVLIDKMKSGKAEIQKQLKEQKGLQRGILAECVFTQTLAGILGLNSFFDLESGTVARIPKEISRNLSKVQEKANTGCSARYAYYKKGIDDKVLFQYGNPMTVGDASLIFCDGEVVIEIKDMPALLGDKDLEYDEQGKLIITEEIKKDYPDYVPIIEEFNKHRSIFNELGHNLPILTEAEIPTIQKFFQDYFDTSLMDVLLSSKNDELIAFTNDQLTRVFANNEMVLSTKGSEIRTTGKNYKTKVFTPDFLNDVLTKIGAIVDKTNNTCKIVENNPHVIGYIKGRGRNDNTRFKINECFFVKTTNIIKRNGYLTFKLDKIHQSKSGISIHINVDKSKKDLWKLLNNAG